MAAPSPSPSRPTRPSFKLTPRQAEAQKLLACPQRHTLLVGGARSGKTFTLVRAIVIRAMRAPGSRHAILRFRYNAVRASVWLDTLPKVVNLCYPGLKLQDQRQDSFTVLPNGSQIWFGGLDDKERVEKILGQEYATIYLNEASQIPFSSAVVAETRLAQVVPGLKQRLYVDMNPTGTGHWAFRQYVRHVDPVSGQPLNDPESYAFMFLNPRDNEANLDPETLKALANLPERQRRRFFDGQFVAEIDGALWQIEAIEAGRRAAEDVPDLRRIVVAVDPSGTAGKDDKRSDDVGINVAGLGVDGHGYVLADRTCNLPPASWARRAVEAYRHFKADCIVAESNFGGEMVRATIQTVDPNVPVKLVTASRGKVVRAEPVSALYEKGLVHHVGRFPELEDQMGNFSTSGYMGERSPDRADAMIWAITELMLGNHAEPSIRFL